MTREALILQGSTKNRKDILYILHVPNRNAIATLQIEVWLDLFNLVKELGLTKHPVQIQQLALKKKTPDYIR